MRQGIVSWLGQQLRTLGGLILPLATRKNVSAHARVLWWVGFVGINGLILVVLCWANRHFNLPQDLQRLPAALKPYWLPIIWLFELALAWTGYWLWKLLTPPEPASDWPDIDAAWAAGLKALRRNKIPLKKVPLFLILGKLRGDERNLFDAAGMDMPVPGVPGPGAPVRVFCANFKSNKGAPVPAIFVCCPDASVLAAQAAFLAGELVEGDEEEAVEGDEQEEEDWDTASIALDGTIVPGKVGGAQKVLDLLSQGQGAVHSPVTRHQLTQEERASRRRSLSTKVRKRRSHRLWHVCKLIARDRYPVVPASGILVLLPFAGTDSREDAGGTGDACASDLRTSRDALGLHCPVLSLLCDMEAAPGFAQLAARHDAEAGRGALGQSFPYLPILASETLGPADALRNRLRSLAAWLCGEYLLRYVCLKCCLETEGEGTPANATRTNHWLILFSTEMRNRQEHLGTVLCHGFSSDDPQEWPLYGGCYLGGTVERNAPSEGDHPDAGADRVYQAFVKHVLDRLYTDRRFVFWTEEVREEDARLQRLVTRGWVSLGVIAVAATLGLLYILVRP